MEMVQGNGRGSYIWGRSVHNTRIECLWADITIGVGATWHQLFTDLEVEHDMQVNNPNHVWLLQHLFLHTINSQLEFWANSWNLHLITIRSGPNQRPEDMFRFDMLVHSLRGDSLEEHLTDEELELFGVDWDAYQEDAVLQQLRSNYANESTSSWLRRRGPPPELNEVLVTAPSAVLSQEQVDFLDVAVAGIHRSSSTDDVYTLWTQALIVARILQPDHF
ncbi:hypothetical protein BT96DRAFT_834264 [Gymnopus androsaceus JB14]|uniref:Integrase core domain-containing protein n=1 Tax=Gymnopus androsaceus JB14 TaxID=1447944 RepID=A0A6A4GVP1_9AGAR|nr:hypothetical protein BT96DRAFT_834264 [Gymnopus androsaceus JB14]